MPRRKHLPLPVLLALSLVCAVIAGALIQVRRPEIGQQAVQEQIEARTPRERCDRLGDEWLFVFRTNPDVSLCYKAVWGWPNWERTSISPEAYRGKAYRVTFGGGGFPYVSFETPDFQLTGPSDYPSIAWSALEGGATDAELQARLRADEAQTLVFNNVRTLRVRQSGIDLAGDPFSELHYFVFRPGFHIRITTIPEYQADIETMLRASL